MPGRKSVRAPLILFGEGTTEALFLERLKQVYSDRLKDKIVFVGHGNGGSAGRVLLELKKKHLDLGDPGTPALLLIDADKGLDADAGALLRRYENVRVVFSKPQCLEGFLLDLLGDLPPKQQRTSEQLKKYFQDEHLGSREGIRKEFKRKRATLFPKGLLDRNIASHLVLREIGRFLGVPGS